jgi:hypothetical protein
MVADTRILHLRCYAELNDFLPEAQRYKAWPYRVSAGASIADLITALSLPHEHIALILVDGRRVGLEYVPGDGARVTLYPAFATTGALAEQH